MRLSLPYGGFEGIGILNFYIIDLVNIKDDADIGYILEVNLDYITNLRSKHKNLSLCPEHFAPPLSETSKLNTSFYHKKYYITHYTNLKPCLDLGLKLTTIHRVLNLKQKPRLGTDIAENVIMILRKKISN